MITQIAGVTGRKRRDGRKEEVETKAPYLLSAYANKDARDAQARSLALQEQGLEQSADNAREALEADKEQAAASRKLSIAGLSTEMGTGLGSYLNSETPQAEKVGTDAAKNALIGGTEDAAKAGLGDFFNDPSATMSDTDSWTKALTDKGSYLGAFNAPLGAQLAKTLTGSKDNDWVTGALGGAGAAVLTDAFMNPASDFYSSALNAITGGGVGAAFSFF
ncbi:MAG: hypothetical protein KKE73_10960 [Proteobacteria bacterium]|nr:hypothetical protein [Pseudomonadota bacterium]